MIIGALMKLPVHLTKSKIQFKRTITLIYSN